SKKRKLDFDTTHTNGASGSWLDASASPAVSIQDVGFQMPQRKKLKLEWLGFSSSAPNTGGIRAVGNSGDVEFGLSWQDVDQMFCLPVPEKAKPSWNFVVMPVSSSNREPILWNTPEPSKKDIEAGTATIQPQTTIDSINQQLAGMNPPKRVHLPDYEEFCGQDNKSYKKGEKRAWVRAWRGTKDGYLFFLPQGILFAFKKPLLFIPLENIESISYTSVVQITFNLVVSFVVLGNEDPEEVEFGMIDQNDHTPIDAYVQKHSLQDTSMAAERRAKRLNINPPEGKGTENGDSTENAQGAADDGADDETELQRAERLLQDAEDDEEEDYDPDAEGDSDDSEGSEGSEGEDAHGGGSDIEEVDSEDAEDDDED
ncbi:Rtt106-domain-containing protein, partial [Eremomyces bilateralis CBS 781.70]